MVNYDLCLEYKEFKNYDIFYFAFWWAYENKTMDQKGTGRQKQKKSFYREN